MEKYESYIEELENDSIVGEDAKEAGADAMSFVASLHNVFKENGVDLPEEPDLNALESIVDGILGELSAASIFLSEDSFKEVPKMLRSISRGLKKADVAFTDVSGEFGPSVPAVVKKGFSRLADRIEATRYQKKQMAEVLKNS